MDFQKHFHSPLYLFKQDFFEHSTEIVAQKLLGAVLVREIGTHILVGRIVETEAYTIDDPASHCYRGKTVRNSAMFGSVGHAYVYFTYGAHFCLNVVARSLDCAAGGVLIRALEPLYGIDNMQINRISAPYNHLTNGPGKLTQALAIDRQFNHHNLLQRSSLYLAYDDSYGMHSSGSSSRIGISQAQEVQHRFFIKNNCWVSKVIKTV